MKDDTGAIQCRNYLKKVLKRKIIYSTYNENVMLRNPHPPIYLYQYSWTSRIKT